MAVTIWPRRAKLAISWFFGASRRSPAGSASAGASPRWRSLLGILILIHWIEREGLKDMHDGQRQLPRRHLFHDDQRDDDRLRRHRPRHRPHAHVRRDCRHPNPDPVPAHPRRLGLCVRCAAFLGKIHHEANPAHPLRPHHRRRLRDQEQPRGEGADRPRLEAGRHRRHRHQRRPARKSEIARLHGAQGRRDPRRDAAGRPRRPGEADDHLRRARRHVDPHLPDRAPPRARLAHQRGRERPGQ